MIPRGRVGALRFVDRAVDVIYTAVGGVLGTYERRDSLRSSQAAAVLAGLLLFWLGGLLLGFALLLWGFEPSFGAAVREAGSSVFTLGFAARPGSGPSALDFLAAASGLVLVALQISYLPTLYAAYNRRETELALLSVRAGEPPWGAELLARSTFGGLREDLHLFYLDWERWAADVSESHSSYPILMRFRSPHPRLSWLVGMLAVLDSAAMYLAIAPSQAPAQARLCLRMGIYCFGQLARTVGIRVDDDPRPDDPIALTFEEFEAGYARMVQFGFPVELSAEEAWPQFRGWRVNYERSAYGLAYGIDAVPALWSGPRRYQEEGRAPVRLINRTPEDPDGSTRPRPPQPRGTGNDPSKPV